MAKIKKTLKQQRIFNTSTFFIYWTKENYYFLLLGIALLVIGFYLMSLGEWDNPVAMTISPIILVISYFLVIPISILYKKKNKKENTSL